MNDVPLTDSKLADGYRALNNHDVEISGPGALGDVFISGPRDEISIMSLIAPFNYTLQIQGPDSTWYKGSYEKDDSVGLIMKYSHGAEDTTSRLHFFPEDEHHNPKEVMAKFLDDMVRLAADRFKES